MNRLERKVQIILGPTATPLHKYLKPIPHIKGECDGGSYDRTMGTYPNLFLKYLVLSDMTSYKDMNLSTRAICVEPSVYERSCFRYLLQIQRHCEFIVEELRDLTIPTLL